MKYISIDLETTGLNETYCQIIEIGAVIDDTNEDIPLEELPTFHCYVTHDIYKGDPYALSLHSNIFKRIHDRPTTYCFESVGYIARTFQSWITKHFKKYTVTVAGKNFMSFDMQFLKRLPNFKQAQFHHRCIDPALMFWDPKKDKALPNLQECMNRAGIEDKVSHTALEDAFSVIKLIRKGIENG